MADEFNNNAEVGSAVTPCPTKEQPLHWVAIELVGEDDEPIPWVEYQVQLSDKTLLKGYLDGNGYILLDGLTQAGNCGICFPELDKDAWTFIETVTGQGPGQ